MTNATPPVTVARTLRLWSPLAASWLLMAVELPLLAIVVGHLPDEKIHLAAYGSIVFPLSLLVEGRIIMLLAASTALCTHWKAYLQVRRFMMAAGGLLTALHIAIAFTPLYYFVASGIMGAPEEILEPARLGLQIMTPWTFSIAYRRFQQGVLIRHEKGGEVTMGTVVRLVTNCGMLFVGATMMDWPGIVVGSVAVATGVVAEAAWIGLRVRPILREHLLHAPAEGAALTRASFLQFYIPLALTPLITLFIQPIGAAAMARMPNPLESLAAWPAIHGLVFITRSLGMAYQEVVVTLVGEPSAVPALVRFHRRLAACTMGFLLLLAATPLAAFWFSTVTGLEEDVASLCRIAVALSILMPGYAVLQSWFQGVLMQQRRTRPIPEAVCLYFVLSASLLFLGVQLQVLPGIWWALGSFVCAGLVQTTWLWWRSREAVVQCSVGENGKNPSIATPIVEETS